MQKLYITRWPAKGIIERELIVDPEGWTICDGRVLRLGRDCFADREAAFDAICLLAERKLAHAQKSVEKYEALIARLHETGGAIPLGE